MQQLGKNIRNNRGYSLVEVMVATVIGMILVAGATATFIMQNRSYAMTESISEVNSQSKMALDIMAKEIRLTGMGVDSLKAAGYGLPAVNPIDGGAGDSDSLLVSTGLRSVGRLSTDPIHPSPIEPISKTLSRVYLQDAEGTLRRNPGDNRWLSIDGVFFTVIVGCTVDAGAEDPNVCIDPNDATGLIVRTDDETDDLTPFQLITTNDSNKDGVLTNADLGRPVYAVVGITYALNAESMELTRNNGVIEDVIAQNIEDLQFAYAVDINGDGNINAADDQNGDGAFDANDFVDSVPLANAVRIKAVRISLLARADRADLSVTTENPPANLENRVHAATNDGFRRRLWQTVVNLRNMQDL